MPIRIIVPGAFPEISKDFQMMILLYETQKSCVKYVENDSINNAIF